MSGKITGAAIDPHLIKLGNAWQVIAQHHISKVYIVKDFMAGVKLLEKFAGAAEAANHHPDVTVSYGQVRVDIWSHDVDGLTERDFALAAKLDAL